jgi:hypothetical protein
MKTLSERLWARVEKDGHDGCWVWTGALVGGRYGVIGRTQARQAGNVLTHIAAYTELVGEIPDGYQIDHLCLNTRCCNPAHLEAVTQAENLRRQQMAITHCIRGHEFTPENTHVPAGTTKRQCRECIKIRTQNATEKRRDLKSSQFVMSEAQLMRSILELTRWLGLLAFHSGDSRRDSCAGFPDLVIAGRGGVIYREAKTATGRLRPEQMDWISILALAGADVAVWRPVDLSSGVIEKELKKLAKGKP